MVPICAIRVSVISSELHLAFPSGSHMREKAIAIFVPDTLFAGQRSVKNVFVERFPPSYLILNHL